MNIQNNPLVESFKQMWDNYPAPVLLADKSHDIISCNKVATKQGFDKVKKCYHFAGQKKICSYCKAANCLKEQKTCVDHRFSEKLQKFMSSYWIPIDGAPDLFIHFANDISELVRPELLP